MAPPSGNLVRVVLGTGRLTIARAIGNFFFCGEDELRKFSEEKKKKKKNNVAVRTHAHSFNSPVQLPLAH